MGGKQGRTSLMDLGNDKCIDLGRRGWTEFIERNLTEWEFASTLAIDDFFDNYFDLGKNRDLANFNRFVDFLLFGLNVGGAFASCGVSLVITVGSAAADRIRSDAMRSMSSRDRSQRELAKRVAIEALRIPRSKAQQRMDNQALRKRQQNRSATNGMLRDVLRTEFRDRFIVDNGDRLGPGLDRKKMRAHILRELRVSRFRKGFPLQSRLDMLLIHDHLILAVINKAEEEFGSSAASVTLSSPKYTGGHTLSGAGLTRLRSKSMRTSIQSGGYMDSTGMRIDYRNWLQHQARVTQLKLADGMNVKVEWSHVVEGNPSRGKTSFSFKGHRRTVTKVYHFRLTYPQRDYYVTDTMLKGRKFVWSDAEQHFVIEGTKYKITTMAMQEPPGLGYVVVNRTPIRLQAPAGVHPGG